MRPFVRRGSDAWLMATVALGIVLDNVVLFTFGKEPRSLPSPLAQTPIELGGVGLGVYPLQVLIPIVGLLLAAALHALSRRTRWGTAMLAVVQNRDAARLMGIPIRRVVALAYALSTLFAGVAGVLIAPLFNVNADMGTLFGLKAFAVAILGGITSAWGVMVAGLLFGIAEALITTTLGLELHADPELRAGHRRARAATERAVRPRRGEEGVRVAVIVALWRGRLGGAERQRLLRLRAGQRRAAGDRRHRPQRAARPDRAGLVRPRRLLRHRRLRGGDPDDQGFTGASGWHGPPRLRWPARSAPCSRCRRCAPRGRTWR